MLSEMLSSAFDQIEVNKRRNEFIQEKRKNSMRKEIFISLKGCIIKWSARIVGCHKNDEGIWIYDIVINAKKGDSEWGCYTIGRRFSEFKRLHHSMRKIIPNLIEFPATGIRAWMSSSPASAINRIKPLQGILDMILNSSEAIKTNAFMKFMIVLSAPIPSLSRVDYHHNREKL